jgi:poly(3-hydroxybutyrate) depolymerase
MNSLCFLRTASFALLFMIAGEAWSATSVSLPNWICVHPDAIFVSEFDPSDGAVPSNPSGGTGGAHGSLTKTLHIAGLGTGTQHYYLYVPSNYTATTRAWPLLLALPGVTLSTDGDNNAAGTRDDWIGAASAGRFIVAVPVGNDVGDDGSGIEYVSWLVPPHNGPTDYDLFAAVRADVEASYNIERTRIYGWGFSAGGHVMHDLAINTYSSAFNATTMAAYSVSAGDLAGLACYSDASCNALLAALPRKIPVDIHIGTYDPNYPYAQSDHTRFLAKGWVDGSTIHYTEFVGDHEYDIAQLTDVWNHLCPNAVTP